MDALRALADAGGVARYKELRDAGVPQSAMALAIAEGTVVRPHRGCYALASTPWPDVVATIFRGQPACVTVLETLGLPVVPGALKPHIEVPSNRSLGRPGIRDLELASVHHTEDVADARRPLLRALDASWRCIGRNGQLAAMDAALRLGLMRRDEVLDFTSTPRQIREWLRRHGDPLSESPMESFTRAAMIDAGVPFVPQVEIAGVGRVDFVVANCCVVECDGFAYHSDRERFEEDRRRSNALTTLGIPHLRYAYSHVMRTPEEIIADVRALIWRATG
ncbi:type IV toxin-antitoxin system AbiEi family antitoxin domain-containing protein [Demequina sp. SYSU T00039]|uniref:Type IV toxin-antitoxin system AbiEi family antitoxin domain-containing protein n=1 Tax=Demequina lignilytica TaxID=3051663 RepID=A0AAW7M9B7_9MICO|nr:MULTISPECIES: type IV toxin-antitoxin system AbiEi family antitoxin domain-containing protein [unclassified Demequina]MDN4477463.1 type IV toxin-antitoxin system AbiEi family antitoxin domain-containing protein [Demequina sp. SYSU T00039-1]MDN4488186.1 type IV toxin-antitoxin system AbiEi family antitoxin domain-containing protein [Demequina sp. SYSU T00039]